MQVIAGICVLVWVMNIGHFNDPIHGGMVSFEFEFGFTLTLDDGCLNEKTYLCGNRN